MKRITIILSAAVATTTALAVEPPGTTSYQGIVNVAGAPFTGTGSFKFALVDPAGTTTHWSNDGTSIGGSEPAAAVSLAVSAGLFTVTLGDTSLANMTQAIPASVFADHPDVRMRTWFDDGVNGWHLLSPDQGLSSVGYALHAATAESAKEVGGVLYVDDAGKVGIGTDNPQALTHIEGAGSSAIGLRVNHPGASSGLVDIGSPAGSPGIVALANNGNRRDIRFMDTGLGFFTSSTPARPAPSGLFIAESGNVGIGTIEPADPLHIVGDVTTTNPNNLGASVTLGWGLDPVSGGDVPRIRISGDGAGANNGLIIQRPGNVTLLRVTHNGLVGIGTADPKAALDVRGMVKTRVLEITGGGDLSEGFDIEGEDRAPEPGMIVSIDPQNPGQLVVSRNAYERTVAGIISGAGGVNPGMLMGQAGSIASGEYPVALTGRVYCQVDAAHGAITPGDLITTSDTPGHGMRVTDYNRAQGAVVGKAMTSLEEGTGLVLVLVSLQ